MGVRAVAAESGVLEKATELLQEMRLSLRTCLLAMAMRSDNNIGVEGGPDAVCTKAGALSNCVCFLPSTRLPTSHFASALTETPPSYCAWVLVHCHHCIASALQRPHPASYQFDSIAKPASH